MPEEVFGRTIITVENYFARSVWIAGATEHVYIQGSLTSHDPYVMSAEHAQCILLTKSTISSH